jgi:hypothetical protein
MSTFWILFVEVLAMVFAASSLEYVRRHPDLFAGPAQTPGDRVAMLTWMPPDGPPGWYVGAALSGADAEVPCGADAVVLPGANAERMAPVERMAPAEPAALARRRTAGRGSVSGQAKVPRPRNPR